MKEQKKNNGQFAKGTSGNPAGRPLGSRNKATLLMEALLEGEASEITRKAIDLAKEGNTHAMGFCLDRLMPPRRDRYVEFEMAPIRCLDDISLAMASITVAISQGKLTPLEGEGIARILTAHANVLVNQDLEKRVATLEEGPQPEEDYKVEVIKRYPV